MELLPVKHEAVPWDLGGEHPESGYVRLAYRWESGDGLPLVALHGSLLNSETFSCLVGQLPGCRLLMVDLPGHGASERAEKGLTDLSSMASAVCALLSRLGVFNGPFGIIGHSLGGTVALLVSRIAPRMPAFFISVEGTTSPEDCPRNGLAHDVASRSIPPTSAEVLAKITALDAIGVWVKSAASMGDQLGLFSNKLFASLVRWLDSGELLKIFARLPVVRYLYGETSGKPLAAMREALAQHANSGAYCVKEAGHFLLHQRPQEAIQVLQGMLADGLVSRPTPYDLHQQAKRRRRTVEALSKLPAGGVGDMKGGTGQSFVENFGSRPALGMSTLLQLQKWNTPTIWNGWEQITEYNFGEECFNLEPFTDHMPQMGVMVGYAVTVVINPGNPAVPREFGAGRHGFREHVASLPTHIPKIVVVQDLDKPRLLGSMWGEVNANLFRALGCIGCICDGAVRDIDEMTTAGFHAMSRGVCIGHAHGGIPLRWDLPVEAFGVTVRPGQLIHADKHGFLIVPEEDEAKLLDASEFMDLLERRHTIRAGKEGCNKSGAEILEDMKEASLRFAEEKKSKFSVTASTQC